MPADYNSGLAVRPSAPARLPLWFDAVTVVGGAVVGAAGSLAVGGSWLMIVGATVAVSSGFHLAWSRVVEPLRLRGQLRAAQLDRLRSVLLIVPEPVSCADPYAVGVFPSALANAAASTVRPPYVSREVDRALDASLRRLLGSGGVVVLRGDPKSGKSRTLWEALRRSAGSRTVYALRTPLAVGPEEPEHQPMASLLGLDLGTAGCDMVLWIDDAHEHFDRGLTRSNLRRFLERNQGAIVAMTVHSHRLNPSNRDGVDRPLIAELRAASDHHALDVRLTAEERAEASLVYPSLADQDEMSSLPAWFAAVDLLRARYRDSKVVAPHGVAVARAAIDWRRAGMPAGITRQQLHELASIELDELPHSDGLTDDNFASALRWACQQVAPWAALVRPIPGTSGDRFVDFDAVTNWVTVTDGPLTGRVWQYILANIDSTTRNKVGVSASRAGEHRVAEEAWLLQGESDDPEEVFNALFGLGIMYDSEGRLDDAEAAYRKLVDGGHPNSTIWALGNLGPLVARRGRVVEAEAIIQQVIDSGHADAAPYALYDLGVLLDAEGRDNEALAAFQRAVETEHIDVVASSLIRQAKLLEDRGEVDRAKAALMLSRERAPRPDVESHALLALGNLIERCGDAEGAQECYAEAVKIGYRFVDTYPELVPIHLFRFANRLKKHNRFQEAEDAYRRTINTRHSEMSPKALVNLANLYIDRGRPDHAVALLHRALVSSYPTVVAVAEASLADIEAGDASRDDRDFEV